MLRENMYDIFYPSLAFLKLAYGHIYTAQYKSLLVALFIALFLSSAATW